MKTHLPYLLVLLAFFVTQCNKSPRESSAQEPTASSLNVHEVTIYGSMTCDHCIEFLRKADSLAITYSFKDVETNPGFYNELVKKVQDANYQGYVSFPVIEVDGAIHVNPEFAQFQNLLR